MEFYRKYGKAVLRKCERMLGNRSDAEDVMQSLFIDLLHSKKADADLAYLYRAATNRCLNLLRDEKRRKELLEKECHALPIGRNRLQDRVVSVDLLAKLAAGLSEREAEILVYHYLDDFTQEQIAAFLNIARRTVWSALQNIQRAAKDLAEDGAPDTSKKGGTP
jgi:RNA polymerase sigma-70 factor (ECF subfamily)